MSKLQGSWPYAADLSNLLPVLSSATILPQLCVSLSLLCLEVAGIQKAAAESSIRTHYSADPVIQQQHLRMGVVRRIRSEQRNESSLTAAKNHSDGTKRRDLLPSKQLPTRRPRSSIGRKDRALSNRRDIAARATRDGFVDTAVNPCQPHQPGSDVPTSTTSRTLTQLNASSSVIVKSELSLIHI